VQEEPENMGAWTFILTELRGLGIDVIARRASAATASGSSKKSAIRQQEIIDKVFK
jgi:2-oxoglutarate dehydrogenase E1 component